MLGHDSSWIWWTSGGRGRAAGSPSRLALARRRVETAVRRAQIGERGLVPAGTRTHAVGDERSGSVGREAGIDQWVGGTRDRAQLDRDNVIGNATAVGV